MFKPIFFYVLLLVSFLNCARERSADNASEPLHAKGELVVAIDTDMPGYFRLGDESYGYQYDLLRAYADYAGVGLRIVPSGSPEQSKRMLARREADMIAAPASHIPHDESSLSVPVYSTSYVMLTGRKRAAAIDRARRFELGDAMYGRKLMIAAGFKLTRDYDRLLDSLRHTQIFVSSESSFDLIEELSRGEYDYLICEKSEAQLGCALVRNVRQIYEFADKLPVSLVVSPSIAGLQSDFTAWLGQYRNSPDYALLNDLYFEKGIVGQVIGQNARTRVPGGISVYDPLIKRISEQAGYDWRMISAIAYSESRFNPLIVSPKGARGLMQIMPSVARQFNVPEGDVMQPEQNILLGVKLLGQIERMLKFSKSTPYADRMRIVLACYNGGIGHVTDARRLARKYGGNPDSWADVSLFLTRKTDPAYNTDEEVRHGAFNPGETLAFVDQVMGRYNNYCSRVQR
ncbi:MAG: transglycosylase SLT domain-containing protein [Rikenellaceae bacterium]|nr:transglycosylase SLT domain-containing protein [Rikenellaceae bacterium]